MDRPFLQDEPNLPTHGPLIDCQNEPRNEIANQVPYRDYIGCRLKTLNVDTGDRRMSLETSQVMEAPNWLLDRRQVAFVSNSN
ncbi:MAG: hypothetical protein R3E01_18445 [Pirellulaceae bacterium]|nr:hypothetical protein [Planctomycetales bacterium]